MPYLTKHTGKDPSRSTAARAATVWLRRYLRTFTRKPPDPLRRKLGGGGPARHRLATTGRCDLHQGVMRALASKFVSILDAAVSDMRPTGSEESLYDRIGGAEAIASMVDRFYATVIADQDLRPYFDHVALDKLRHMQVEFFSAALGGPTVYTGRTVIHAHQGRRITRQHFQAFVQHLFETLADYALSEDDRYAIIARINTYADDVLGSGGPVD
jgi:hemoglobin